TGPLGPSSWRRRQLGRSLDPSHRHPREMMALSTIAVAAMFLHFVCLRQHGSGDGNWGDLLIPVIVTNQQS
ncbi:hypothetical protein ABE418_22850, partial [Brucella intermedia]